VDLVGHLKGHVPNIVTQPFKAGSDMANGVFRRVGFSKRVADVVDELHVSLSFYDLAVEHLKQRV
jgi:hypothetical protein